MHGVAVCIPVLNDRVGLEAVLPAVAEALGARPYTICVVDDGSTDGTAELVEARAAADPRVVLLRRTKNGRGCQRGAATRAGLEWLLAHTDHTVFVDLDADGSQRPVELGAGVEHVARLGWDVVIASKYVHGSAVLGRPLLRRLGSRTYNAFLRVLMEPALRDYSNSYRFYSRRAAEALLRFTPRYTTPVYLVEMMAVWLSSGFHVLEIPTLYAERDGGTSKVTALDAFRGFAGAFDVARGYRAGRYRVGPSAPA